MDEDGYTKRLSLTQSQFNKLNWLNAKEFSFGNYLFDVKDVHTKEGKIILLYKADLKEKSFLEKLAEDLKHSKNKKIASISFVYKRSEPYQLNIALQGSEISYKKACVSISEAVKDKSSPPPKV